MHRAITRSRNYKWWAFGAIGLGLFMGVLDESSLNIAIPEIASHFHTDIPLAQWILLAYVLTVSAVLMPAGRLSDIVGRKRVYMVGLCLFVAGGVLAAFSPGLTPLIMFKALQGVGNGMLTANNMAIIAAIFPSEERGKGMGLMSTTVGLASIAGPIVGGSLVTGFGWRAIFITGVALALLSMVAITLVLDESRIRGFHGTSERPSFDWVGATVSSSGLVLLLLALTNGGRLGWLSPLVLAGLPGFAILLAFFIGWELKAPSPMLDLRLFKRRVFSLGITARALGMLGTAPVIFLMPFYLQGVLGYSAGRAGLVMVANAAAMALAASFSGRLSDRFGWKPFIAGGLALVASGGFLLSRLTTGSSLVLVVCGLAMQGLGQGIYISPNLSSIFGTVEGEKHGVTAALLNLTRTATNLSGTAVATAIVSGVMMAAGHEPRLDVASAGGGGAAGAFTSGMSLAYLAMMSCVILGFVVSLFMVQRKEQVTGQEA